VEGSKNPFDRDRGLILGQAGFKLGIMSSLNRAIEISYSNIMRIPRRHEFELRGALPHGGSKLNMLASSSPLFPGDKGQGCFLFFLPLIELKFPIGATISPHMEIDTKKLGSDALSGSYEEANLSRDNREEKVAWPNASNVTPTRAPPNHKMQRHSNQILGKPKRRSTKNRQKELGARWRGGRVVY
jgi:hypothetical protein